MLTFNFLYNNLHLLANTRQHSTLAAKITHKYIIGYIFLAMILYSDEINNSNNFVVVIKYVKTYFFG